MKFVKTAIAFLMIFSLLLPANAAGNTRNVNTLSDIKADAWYYKYVKILYENNILNGVTDKSFSPESKVKYSEVFALIVRYLGLEQPAAEKKAELTRAKAEGASSWYSGYIQIIYELGIIADKNLEVFGITLNNGKYINIPAKTKDILESPIKRMDAIMYVIKSFELNSSKIKAKNFLPDVSGNGNEFIIGGGYDNDTLQKIKPLIKDFDSIPDEYKNYILKCYYNGIIEGDDKGNINPQNNLKRSEFSKIIAAVIYTEYRTGKEYRTLPDVCSIKQDDFYTSTITKKPVLKKEKSDLILGEYLIKGLSSKVDGSNVILVLNAKNIMPSGYICESYIFKYVGDSSVCIAKINGATSTDAMLPKAFTFTLPIVTEYTGYILTVMREVSSGEIVGLYMVNVKKDAAMAKKKIF